MNKRKTDAASSSSSRVCCYCVATHSHTHTLTQMSLIVSNLLCFCKLAQEVPPLDTGSAADSTSCVKVRLESSSSSAPYGLAVESGRGDGGATVRLVPPGGAKMVSIYQNSALVVAVLEVRNLSRGHLRHPLHLRQESHFSMSDSRMMRCSSASSRCRCSSASSCSRADSSMARRSCWL